MPELLPEPVRLPVPGGKIIDEHVGLASTKDAGMSVAHMVAPAGWQEPAQTPEFDELTLVLRGVVLVEHDGGVIEVAAGRTLRTRAGERIRYRVGPEGAEYLAICTPAFSPETVNRDDEETSA